jgi:hypothetical protein
LALHGARFMTGRQQKIEGEVPYVTFDFETLADYP